MESKRKPPKTKLSYLDYSRLGNVRELEIEDDQPLAAYLDNLSIDSTIFIEVNFSKATSFYPSFRKPKLIQAEITTQCLSVNEYSDALILNLEGGKLYQSEDEIPFVADALFIEKEKTFQRCQDRIIIKMSLLIKPLPRLLPHCIRNFLLKDAYAGNRLDVYSLGISTEVERDRDETEDYCLNQAMDEGKETPLLNRNEAIAFLGEDKIY